jgi:E3 ubiquitin-protein ligase MARCH5
MTCFQVMGTEEGYTFMEDMENKLVLLISMPLIPVLLILGRMIQWEDMLLKFCRRHAPRILTKLFTYGSYLELESEILIQFGSSCHSL